MAFPPRDTAIGWSALSSVRDWAGLTPEPFRAVLDRTGDPQDKVRLFALLDAPTLKAAVQAARVVSEEGGDGAPLTPMQAAQVALVWRICRRICFATGGGSWEDYRDINPLDEGQATESSQQLALVPSSQLQLQLPGQSSLAQAPGTRLVKLSAVLDQGDSTEIPLAGKEQWDAWHATYVAACLSSPPEEQEPTMEQLSALHHRIGKLGLTPYADFAVWVPFGRRGLRAVKFRCWLPAGDGTFFTREIAGPENFAQWECSWLLFMTACIVLDVAPRASLDCYHDTIRRLVVDWPECWHLIVVADDKCRCEHLERVRRQVCADIRAGAAAPPGFSEDRLWGEVFRRAARDAEFWDRQVRRPAASWVAKGARGAPLALEEKLASVHIPGGAAALQPRTEAPQTASSSGKRSGGGPPADAASPSAKSARKRARRQSASGGSPPSPAPPGKGGEASRRVTLRPAGKGSSKGETKCNNWDLAGDTECGRTGVNTCCPFGRLHVCQKCGSPGHRTKDCK